ncbi:hypothetical protein ESCO_005503 [Escovopsis weberi]|uniref:Uncharacterized protein n=1 Tax=Escovopsis weberi TaxID=150374 RepID=A0A0N0RTN3_ESCWE|nr:hypothetical protein ESCO_005503 [Escovopsis weberi]
MTPPTFTDKTLLRKSSPTADPGLRNGALCDRAAAKTTIERYLRQQSAGRSSQVRSSRCVFATSHGASTGANAPSGCRRGKDGSCRFLFEAIVHADARLEGHQQDRAESTCHPDVALSTSSQS